MGAMAVPILADRLDSWRAWVGELNGPGKADFEASNARRRLTAHHAWLQTDPDGSHVGITIHEGPGADGYVPAMMQPDDPFDRWFAGSVAEVHGMDPAGPVPAPAEQVR